MTLLENKSLEEIRSLGFPYLSYSDELLKKEMELLTNLDSSSIIEDKFIKTSKSYTKLASTFFPHMFHTKVQGMKTPIEAWNNDKLLQRAINISKKYSKNPSIATLRSKLMIVSGTQCVSNFRPDVAKLIYDMYGHNGKIYDFSMGYGGRLVGFLSSKCEEYVGVDVNKTNFNGYERIKSLYNTNKVTKFIESGSEHFCEYENYFDLAFSSPPYFTKELYSDDSGQSCVLYPDYDIWLDKFLSKTILNIRKMLKPNGKFAINIADVNIKSKKYQLVNDCIKLSELNGFKLKDELNYSLKKTIGTRDSFKCNLQDYKKEPILIFEKKY